MTAKKVKTLRYLPAAKRTNTKIANKKDFNKGVSTVKSQLGTQASSKAVRKPKVTEEIEDIEQAILYRPTKIETTWFIIALQNGVGKVVSKGKKTDCIKYVAKFMQSNGDSGVHLYMANGFKLLGYE